MQDEFSEVYGMLFAIYGVELGIIAFQPEEVQKSINGFIINLVESILIVVFILWIFMGWRSAAIVGSTLFLTILCTLIYMIFDGVDLQRTSVGSFILALGMLVDNAIVVTDMIIAKMKKGDNRYEAATGTVRETALPLLGIHSVPLGQVVERFDLKAEESMIWRRNRVRTISAQCGLEQECIPEAVRNDIKDGIESIDLPPGYTMEWGGEYYDARRSVKDVLNQLPKVLLMSLVVMVALFNGFRQPLIILVTIPLASTGVVAMLLLAGKPFGFMALVGAIALSGMIIKNGVVLMDQIELERRKGLALKSAVREATVSRTLPISMGELTTLLGMIPLLKDRLFDQMAAIKVPTVTVGATLSERWKPCW